ncbi:hypothetical protein ACKW6Q_12060 [Chryseobacterium kwangjuense]|uniref:Uncharacterized protein n=1 Tax=Chryseobacterium kwangjuense TaxID=267125 RepID=A0ABW9K2Z3_9FLAO
MEMEFKTVDIDIEEIISFFKKEDGIELSTEEATEIAAFFNLIINITMKSILKE